MFAIVQNGIIQLLIPAGSQFTWNGVDYPSNWVNLSTPEEKAAIGMVDVIYGPYPNDQYYWVSENSPAYNAQTNQVDITYTAAPKDLATCKSNQVTAINAQAYSLLQPSDWLVVRSVESGGTFPVPVSWNTWRATIRTQASNAANAVTACTTIDELAALSSVTWTPDPDHIPAVDAGITPKV